MRLSDKIREFPYWERYVHGMLPEWADRVAELERELNEVRTSRDALRAAVARLEQDGALHHSGGLAVYSKDATDNAIVEHAGRCVRWR